MHLSEVFGIATEVNTASYVDRGGLDERLGYYLKTQRHIAIHGDSKQGKSWLRNRLLDAADTIVVQCQVETTPESLFREALGALGVRAELRRSSTSQLEGRLDFSGGGELGNFLFGKMKVDVEAGATTGQQDEVESQPIGTTPGDLSWVARAISASGRKLVIEDFHYVTEDNRKAFAFMLKALGDYGVHVIIVGVWPEDHLLTYYNGDLDGRVEDIRLIWNNTELREVLGSGCRALNIAMSEDLMDEMVRDAYGNVGLVQRLAEEVCLAFRITETQETLIELTASGELATARDHGFPEDALALRRVRRQLRSRNAGVWTRCGPCLKESRFVPSSTRCFRCRTSVRPMTASIHITEEERSFCRSEATINP